MSCRKYKKLFSSYLDGDLDSGQSHRFQDHLAECHHCAAEFANFKKVMALTNNLPPIQPSPAFNSILMAKLTDSENAPESRSPFVRQFIFAFGTTCLLIAALFSVYLYDGDNNIPQRVDSPERIMIGREVVPAVPGYRDENTATNFVMPSIPVTGSFESTTENLDVGQNERNFILPFIMGEQKEEDEPETNYVIRRVSLISASNETGL